MAFQFAQDMRPRDILRCRDESGCAFVPISPMFEWHSYHLPIGTDGIIAETLATIVAERVGGLCFRCLSFALDEWRPAEKLRWWGLEGQQVFGMNFPELPLTSEYCEPVEMLACLSNRLKVLQHAGFRHVFIVNNHGDAEHIRQLRAWAERADTAPCRVHFVTSMDLLTLRNPAQLSVGGHAGLMESVLLMAYRPDLVDMTELPDGELNVAKMGIHHGTPTIEAKWNPRNALLSVANEVRHNMVANFLQYMRDKCGLDVK